MSRTSPPPPSVLGSALELLRSLDAFLPLRVMRKAMAVAVAHDWQYSIDGGRIWVDVDPFDETSVPSSGTKIIIRHRRRERVGYARWSNSVPMVVP